MSVIYKYPLQVTDTQDVKAPEHATFLDAQFQGGQLCAWFLVEPEKATEAITLRIFGTGHPITEPLDELIHLATVQEPGFVWHIFEQIKYDD